MLDQEQKARLEEVLTILSRIANGDCCGEFWAKKAAKEARTILKVVLQNQEMPTEQEPVEPTTPELRDVAIYEIVGVEHMTVAMALLRAKVTETFSATKLLIERGMVYRRRGHIVEPIKTHDEEVLQSDVLEIKLFTLGQIMKVVLK